MGIGNAPNDACILQCVKFLLLHYKRFKFISSQTMLCFIKFIKRMYIYEILNYCY